MVGVLCGLLALGASLGGAPLTAAPVDALPADAVPGAPESVTPAPSGPEPLTPLPAVVHVHSDVSTGQYTLEELVDLAQRQDIGVLLLSENYLNRVEYGLPPFRALTRVSHDSPSVHGQLRAYRERVARVQAAHPGVLVVPGVEVMPHYRWTGSPLTLELTLHDTQKNLLVFGITDPSTLAALPVIGNGAAGAYTLQSVPRTPLPP